MGDKSKLPPGALSFSLSNTPEQNMAALAAKNRLQAQDIIRGAAKAPSFIELQTYLQSRNAFPDVNVGYAGGNMGQFTTGAGVPKNGVVEIGYQSADAGGAYPKNTATHEMTHAADRAISDQYQQRLKDMGVDSRTLPWGVNQFVDAYRKMVFDPKNGAAPTREALAQRFYPEWLKENQRYRANNAELAGFGVGNSVFPTDQGNAPPHVDASAATDFMVLLELAQRDSGKTQGPAPGVLDRLKNLFK